MARVRVVLPSLLATALGEVDLELDADTIEGAFARIATVRPALAVHLFDEDGALRPHVLCFHNGTSTRWLADLARPLADGDELRILQAVSGG